MSRKWLILMVAACAACSRSGARPDRDYDVAVATPAYPGHGPVVLFDEAHRNIHKANGTYAPFAQLIENDGYTIKRNRRAFTVDRLAGAAVLVIANALGDNERNDNLAMTDAEAGTVGDWVERGGSLLLITDHYPTGSAVANLAHRIGIDMSGGVTEDSTAHERGLDASHIVYTNLPAHPITAGVERVVTFTGQSLAGPAGAVAVLPLGPHAIDRAAAPRVERSGGDVRVHVEYGSPTSAAGRAQAIAFELGQGRVVALAEAAMASAQLSAYDGSPFGMNLPGNDNRRFVLNVLHWLSRLN